MSSHLSAPGKRERYLRLLERFGVDANAGVVEDFGGRPALVIFEQPGSYLTPGDLMRARLHERLVQWGAFDADRSGVQVLSHDRFTGHGEKGVFLDFCLHRSLGPARLLSSQYVKNHQGHSYSSLKIGAGPFQRIRSIWDVSLRLIEAAAASPKRFVEVVEGIRTQPPVPGALDLLPRSEDPAELLRIGHDLAKCRLDSAFKTLWPARTHLRRDMPWDVYWSQVNADFLELPIRSISPMFQAFVLAIEEPVRLGRTLGECLGAGPDEAVPVAGIATAGNIFRSVLFDPASETFFIPRGDGSREPIEWGAVADAARSGQGARPAGVILYLMMAAFGVYLLVDSTDSVQPFQETVCRLHEREMGLKFPWLTFAGGPALERMGNSFLEVFRPGFVELTVDSLSGFLDR